jgi:preprotein translocase subunit Sec61beta
MSYDILSRLPDYAQHLASAGIARMFDRYSKRTAHLLPEPMQDAEDDPLSPLMVILIVIAVLLVIIAIVQLF